MDDTALDKPADIGIIRQLYCDGLLSDETLVAASTVLRPATRWLAWAKRMLLFLGSALILAGIIFFFAYNWAAMGRFIKFGAIEAGIVACIVASHLQKKTQLNGKMLLLTASVLVGVLLAVYGQTYQTGADAFGLFIFWAALILGWVLISEFAALWFVWLVLLNSAAILYWQQVGHPAHSIRFEHLCLALAMLNGSALALREVGVQRGLEWLSGQWLRGVLLAAALIALSLPTIGFIIDFERTQASVFAACAWAVAVGGAYALYRYKLRDMTPLALIVMDICLILLTLIGKILFYDTRSGMSGQFLLFALIILGVISGAVFWLRTSADAMASEIKGATG